MQDGNGLRRELNRTIYGRAAQLVGLFRQHGRTLRESVVVL